MQVVVGRDAGDRTERGLAALPQQRPLGLVGRDPHVRAPWSSGEPLDERPLGRDPVGQAVDLDEQHGRRVGRVAGAHERPRRPAVMRWSIISSAAGTIPAAMMAVTQPAASSTDVKSASSVSHRGRDRGEAHGDRGGHAEHALAPDERARAGRSPDGSGSSPPSTTSSPSGSTTSTASTWAEVTP